MCMRNKGVWYLLQRKENGRWDVRSYINKFRREESCEEGYVVVIVINRLFNERT
jgi:hypothetical protein